MSRVLKILNTLVAGGRELQCEACGAKFVCGVSLKGCWCAEIELDDDARRGLRDLYSDCLCRQCLERVATENK